MALTLPDLDENPNTWTEATAALRLNLYWFVVAGGLLAAALFGTAFVSRPSLSWEDNGGRLLLAWGLATVGIGCAVAMLGIVVSLYRPQYVRLSRLPATLEKGVDDSPAEFLPPDVPNVAQLVKLVPAYYALARVRESELGAAQDAEAAAPEAERSQRAIETAHRRGLYDAVVARYEELLAAATALLDRAGYESLVTTKKAGWLVALAIITGSMGVGFQLLLTTPTAADSPAAAAAAIRPGTAGTLVRDPSSAANNALWKALNLAPCATGRGADLPILVDGGKGTAEAPYLVRTIPEAAAGDGCPRISFNAVDTVARVSLPADEVKVTVDYPPAPEPSPSASR